MAERPLRLDVPLHPDLGLVDEGGRGILLKTVAAETEKRCLRLAQRVRRSD